MDIFELMPNLMPHFFKNVFNDVLVRNGLGTLNFSSVSTFFYIREINICSPHQQKDPMDAHKQLGPRTVDF